MRSSGSSDTDDDTDTNTNTDSVAQSETLLELLGDRYARRILESVRAEPMTAQRVADAASISEPTAYRRLDRLERAGLVASELSIDADGNHYKQYRAVLERVLIAFGDDGPTVSVRTSRRRGDERRNPAPTDETPG